jgi:hypothetical protein
VRFRRDQSSQITILLKIFVVPDETKNRFDQVLKNCDLYIFLQVGRSHTLGQRVIIRVIIAREQ